MMSSMKPAPLQFVKLAPSDLYRSAQDQLNKTAAAVVVQKPKPKEFEADWQSDLDNWKSNRRKQQEHIIERLVEVKKFETDRLDDGFRKRSKTFNEMIQERGRSGRLRSLPALYQDEDDGNDLSDLGLSTGKKNDAAEDEDEPHCVTIKDQDQEEDVFRGPEEPVVIANTTITTITNSAPVKVETMTTTMVTDPENGYDRAIKDYVDFAESKRTSIAKCEELQQYQQQHQQPQQPPPCRKPLAEIKRRMSAPKIEEKVMLLKIRSQSTKDLNAAVAGELPRVDIGKRREIFEKICSETKAVAEVQQTVPIVAARQQVPLLFVKKKSLEKPPPPPPPPPPTIANIIPVAAVIRQPMIEEIPESPPPETEHSEVPEIEQPQSMVIYGAGSSDGGCSSHSSQSSSSDGSSSGVQELLTVALHVEEEKPIVALEKERVCMAVQEDDEYHHIGHHHHHQLSSLSDLVSRHSIECLDQVCGHTAEDQEDDGNYPGSCLSAEDSGIHTEDMSSCVSQADDEERSNLQPSPVLQLQQPPCNAAVLQQHHADDTYNMVLELTPVNALEPPKEKPPPPPVDAYPDDDLIQGAALEPVMDSVESAKRIKKEMWMKRSSFLGLEEYTNGCNAGYEHDLENLKSKPPDLTSFLEEERRLEKLLYSQNKPERHDTSRIYENVNLPSQNVYVDDGGDNESSQYMRDILQVEEQSRCNQLKNKAAQNNIGEKLVMKLKELEEDLNNQECSRVVGSAHWLPPTRHSMQDISSAIVVNTNARPPLDHTQSMPNLEQPVHGSGSQHHQTEDFAWAIQNSYTRPAQQNVYAKRKPINGQPEKYNYQHWLIQEAEHRRLVDRCNRQVPPGAIASNQPRSRSRPSLPPPPPPSHSKKPLPDSVINTLTQRVQDRQDRLSFNDFHRHDHISGVPQESMLSVSGKKKCSHCAVELGRGAAMIIESLQLFYHIECFKCCVCCVQLGDGLMGTDVRVRNKKLHCHNCFSSDDGVKFSCV
ncbi:Hypothetical protein CINCED_3A015255 [Cinara cedri]|uniref:LIM zinc-binding domain-containing protein n=1 Tax=Cinara cedri TaxID=506608 RepID=A0A5E4M7G7_9HEMI|nr:Hypothetical protein CINCED_3A015255 [Cinara cedri]